MSRPIYKPGDQVLFGGTWHTIKSVNKTNKNSYYYELVGYGFYLDEKELLDRVMEVKKRPIEYRQIKLL